MIAISQNGLARTVGNLRRARSAVRVEVRRGMERAVRIVESDLKRKGMTGHKGSHPLFGVTGASGDTLGARSGHTRRSVTGRVLDVGPAVVGVVGTPEKYVRLHEEGGTIQGNQYLRIPTRHAQTGAGVDRHAGMSIRDIPGAFLLRSKAGNLWAAIRRGAGQPLELLYLLKRSVRLRARRVFARTLDRTRPAIRGELRKASARIVARGNGAP